MLISREQKDRLYGLHMRLAQAKQDMEKVQREIDAFWKELEGTGSSSEPVQFSSAADAPEWQKVAAYMRANPGKHSPKDLASALGKEPQQVRAILQFLKRKGHVSSSGYGEWEAVAGGAEVQPLHAK